MVEISQTPGRVPSPFPCPGCPNQHLGVLLIVVLLCADPAAHEVVAYSVGQRKVVVSRGGHIAVLYECEMQVPVEVLLQVSHILHAGQASNTDLLSLLLVCQRPGHGCGRVGPTEWWKGGQLASVVPPAREWKSLGAC